MFIYEIWTAFWTGQGAMGLAWAAMGLFIYAFLLITIRLNEQQALAVGGVFVAIYTIYAGVQFGWMIGILILGIGLLVARTISIRILSIR